MPLGDPKFNYYRGNETPFDFSPITRGGESLGSGFESASKAFLESATQAKLLAQRKAEMQQQSQDAAQSRLLSASEGQLNRDAEKTAAFQKSVSDMALQQEHNRSLTAAEAAKNASEIEQEKIRAGSSLQVEQMRAAEREKEKQDALKSQAYGSQFYRALNAAHADDSTEPVIKSTKTRAEWLFPGLSDSEVDVVLKGMYHDPEQAKAAAQYMKGKETIRVFDEGKANALLDQAHAQIVKPGDETYADIGRQGAIEQFKKSNSYASDPESGISRVGEAFLKMFPANVRMQAQESRPVDAMIGGMKIKVDPSNPPTPEQLIGHIGTAVGKQMDAWDAKHGGNTPEVQAQRNAVAEDKIRSAAMEAGLDPDQVLQALTKKPETAAPAPAADGKPPAALDRLEALKKKYQK